MHILELDSYNLSDTVKFHDRLNPRLWDSAEHLRPEVADKLMEIARDFQEFMGVPDLDIVDITISGSNAAYNYTGSSDIDLHLVINVPKVTHDEVYRELFNAKKYEYNDIHDIRIGGADVELYAQDSEQPHHSQGIYSLLNRDWISIPRRRRSTIDDVSTRSKYEDLAARVDSTIKTQDRDRMAALMSKIKTMRQTGLEQQGEFGADNLAFKLLRNNGYIKRLIDARNAARDAELSLAELAKPRQTVTYGFTTESPDGVNPTTKMFLENEPSDQETTVQEFIDHVIGRLGIDPRPEIVLHSDPAWSKQNQSFGRYNADTHALEVNLLDRHIMDILRTVAHELVHCRQNQQKPLPDHAGKTGSPWENDANARAGVIMRDYAESNPEKFTESASGYIPKNKKEARDPRFSMALTQDIRPGQAGKEANKLALKTNAQGQPGLLMKTVNLREGQVPPQYQDLENPPGPESKPTMPKGTVRVDVSDMYDWYKLGKNISNLKAVDKSQFGAGPPSTIVSFGDEDLEHEYIKQLEKLGLSTTDIDPVDPDQPLGTKRQKVDPTYNVAESFGIETYPIPLPIGDYLGPDPEFAPPGNYKDSGDLHEEVWDLMDAGVEPQVANIDPKRLVATQDWLSNEGGSEPLFPEFPDRPVVYKKAGKFYILDGHHRITKAFKAGRPISVYLFSDQQAADLDENFADGKNPQDKGDSARHGIPKKASISSLRKIAKQGGRKGQLAHWQANMRSGRAKANETIAESEQLFEINMSPTNLKKLAAETGALAGMEFEMIVPGVDGGNDNDDLEPDYDYDERVTSIDDAVQFFNDGDYNDPREIRRLRDSMSDSYQEWLGEAWMEHFESYKNSIVFRFGKENWEEAQIAEILGLDEAETEALETRGASPEDYMDAAEKVIADGLDPWLNDAQEDAQEEYYDDDHQEDWLRSQGLNYMSNIPEQYDMISWPHWSSGGDEGAAIESVADEFREAIGRKVNWSDSYHGGKREPNAYVVEPDTSLNPADSDDAGLEFISPPLPIDEMISDLNKVKAWADQRGCYTSKAAKTGLHINVSVPGFDNDKLDYVKLALLLGDEYVLNQFGRLGNGYAASAMGIIKERIAQRPADAAAMLQKMKEGMANLASKVVHSGSTSKYTSINTKDGYIEFRSPGGDWLGDNFDKIETTLMRFVVALDAAMDPAKYRDEYLKKLYAVLKPKDQNDTLSYFVKFAAGELPQAVLKSFIRQVQLERSKVKDTYAELTSGQSNYKIYQISDGRIMGTFYAADQTQADAEFTDWLMSPAAGGRDDFRYAPIDTPIQGPAASATTPQPDIVDTEPDEELNFLPGPGSTTGGEFTGEWQVMVDDYEVYRFSGVGNNQGDANRIGHAWVLDQIRRGELAPVPGAEVEVLPIMS